MQNIQGVSLALSLELPNAHSAELADVPCLACASPGPMNDCTGDCLNEQQLHTNNGCKCMEGVGYLFACMSKMPGERGIAHRHHYEISGLEVTGPSAYPYFLFPGSDP